MGIEVGTAMLIGSAIAGATATASAVMQNQASQKQRKLQREANANQILEQQKENARENARNAEQVKLVDDNETTDSSIFNAGGTGGISGSSSLGKTNSLNSSDDWFGD